MLKEKYIKVILQEENNILWENTSMIFINDYREGLLGIGYDHEYIRGVGISITLEKKTIDKKFIYYGEKNIFHIYFE